MIPVVKRAFISLFIIICLLQVSASYSQQSTSYKNIHFYHLTTAQGLSDNYVWDMCQDKTGNLWVGTQDGLNMFNGRSVSWFLSENHPQLNSDYIRKLYCDELNRIWVFTQGGYTALIDENRKFHKIILYDSAKPVTHRWLLHTAEHGAVIFTKKGFFKLDKNKNVLEADSLANEFFTRVDIKIPDTLLTMNFTQFESFDENKYILNNRDGFSVIDFKENKSGNRYLFPGINIIGKWLPGELLVYNRKEHELQSINLKTQLVSKPLSGIKDQHGEQVTELVHGARMINDETLLLTVNRHGMYLFNYKTKVLMRYWHDAADPTTIINEWPKNITVGNNGWIFIGCRPNGLSYFKSDAVIGEQLVFMDKKGNSYDGHVSSIATLDNNTFYIGVGNNLLKWNRNTNSTVFVDYAKVNGEKMMNNDNVGQLNFDNMNRLWLRTLDKGAFVLDKNDRAIKFFKYDTVDKKGINTLRIHDMEQAPDGYMWVTTTHGLRRIDLKTFEVDDLGNTPLALLKSMPCDYLFFPGDNTVWVGTEKNGVWHYSFATNSLENFNENNGFIGNYVLAINKDNDGNIYVGTDKGLQVFLANGKTMRITQKEGLMHPRAEVLIPDKRNRMWIGNDVGIACFNIADSSLRYFDETYGLSIQGFRVASFCHTSEDEQVWGTERGIQYFFPDDLYNYKPELKVTINRIESRNLLTNITQSGSYQLAANDNYITFYFSTIEYQNKLRNFYQYKLEGVDEDWIKVVNQNSVRYSALSPGKKYVFKVRASNDNKVWYDAENEVTIHVASPFYNTWWFKSIVVLAALGLIWYVFNFYRRRQQKKTEELETELVINYFASQINSRYKKDELLWDVARNLIAKLGFEECMIYIWNDDKTELIQKAGYGSKGSMETISDRTLYNISKGKGIVGAAVESKQILLINDTSKDKRYFTVDDKVMLSELCVPLLHDNEVLGAINIEQHQRNFFTQKHQKMLSTIAVLCANQLQRIRAEEEKQQARIEALQNKQKAVETRLQSLRLQMNPHFLFNALNSVQQMILANEEMVATRYLSKFSKLLRTILVHSDKEFVTLKEELEILNLYVDLESMRFKESFNYHIKCDDEIDTDEIKLPTLLIQPFVENAIWHGLMHKEGERLLTVRFSEKDDCIECIVEDNGIGREKASEAKLTTGQGSKHTSKGIAVSIERLQAMGNGNGKHGSMRIIDLKDESGKARGTMVEIIFPIKNN